MVLKIELELMFCLSKQRAPGEAVKFRRSVEMAYKNSEWSTILFGRRPMPSKPQSERESGQVEQSSLVGSF